MSTSLVIRAALVAFQDAIDFPAKQPVLAEQRKQQKMLFDDIVQTLAHIPEAPDTIAYKDNFSTGKRYELRSEQLREWIGSYPDGVAFPITIAKAVDPSLISAPMRILLLVPFTSKGSFLGIPRQFAKHFVRTIPLDSKVSLGGGAAIAIGMFCDANGMWEYGPVAGWLIDAGLNELVAGAHLPILPDTITMRADQEKTTFDDASLAYLHEYVTDEILILLGVDH